MASWKAGGKRMANRLLGRFGKRMVGIDELWRPTRLLGSQPQPVAAAATARAAYLNVYSGKAVATTQPAFDFAVVMPTTLRSTIADALRSVFDQRFPGSMQILVGVDAAAAGPDLLAEICRSVPDRCSVLCFYPGYSTSRRHGGLHAAWDGGALRTMLTYLANSRCVAYLDDDNWWASDHLASMHEALQAADWAYAYRWFVHPVSRRPICRDDWESVGPGQGVFATGAGPGWVDPNCLAIDKLACEAVLRWWSIPLRNSQRAMDADRNVFRILASEFTGRATGRHSVFYNLDESDQTHPQRLQRMGEAAYAAAGGSPARVRRAPQAA